MADSSHNTLAWLDSALDQLQQAEAILLRGTTIGDLSATLECSPRQARRIVDLFRRRGHPVTDDFKVGTQTPTVFQLATSGRMFHKRKA